MAQDKRSGGKRNLKICIFTETYFPVVGGGETQARLLAEGLAENGCSVTIVTRRSHPSLAGFEKYGDIRVYRLPPTGSEHLKKWGLLLSSFPALFRLRRQYDLILVSGFRVIGIAAVISSKLLGKACVLKADNNGEMSGEFFRGGLAKAGWKGDSLAFRSFLGLRNRILRQADNFVAISALIAEEYEANGVYPASRIHCIPNSVDTSIFHPVPGPQKRHLREKLALPRTEILAAFTGRLVSYKGLPHLLNVWGRLARQQEHARLLLIGAGSMDIYNCEAQLKDYVRSNGLEERVLFCGEVRNVHEYLQAADVFVFPTEREAFGIAVIEAMACGLPVITTPVGGLKEIITHDKNGLVVSPGDEEGLFLALDKLMSDEGLAQELGRRAVQTVRDRYGVEVVTGKYLALFRNLV